MRCFYHKADLDGHCSGAIIKWKYPECEMIGVDYGDSISQFGYNPPPYVKTDDIVYIVDFSFPIEEMEKLSAIVELHWIDHHKTNIEKARDACFLASGTQSLEIGKAACELTWEHLYEAKKMPTSVNLLGRYDVWDHEDPRVLKFQYGMRRFKDTLPCSSIWGSLFLNNSKINSIVDCGEAILDYVEIQNERAVKLISFETEILGFPAIAINSIGANSKIFDSVYDELKHYVLITFHFDGKDYKYGLYSRRIDVDVSKIAEKFGGGGHRQAAGFISKKMILKNRESEEANGSN